MNMRNTNMRDRHYREIGARMRECRMTLNMTQDDVARMIGRPLTNSVSRWENGEAMPPVTDFPMIATALQTSVEFLITGNLPFRKKVDKESNQDSNTVKLPYYGGVSAGQFTPPNDIVEEVEIAANLLEGVRDISKCFVLTVNGDSMSRIIPSGNRVIIETLDADKYNLHSRDILLVRNGSEYTLKRLRKTEKTIILEPESHYEGFVPKEYPIDSIPDMEVVGRVIVSYKFFV